MIRPHRAERRMLHPGAWWAWAVGMAVGASRTTNVLLLGLLFGVVALVVAARRSDAPWANGFHNYLYMALTIVALRVIFRAALDGSTGEHILFTLPEIPLPDCAAGIRIGGPVAAEGLVAAVRDGVRLATLIVALGAANILANPKRLLASVPSALHELGVAVTVGISVAPQLVESAQRINRARRLRGEGGRRRDLLRGIVVPVATDALDRSLLLAAAMDSRGHGRAAAVNSSLRVLTAALTLGGLVGMCVGIYGVLDASVPPVLGLPMLLGGVLSGVSGFILAGRRIRHTRYRPDPWRQPEWAVVGCGVFVAGALVVLSGQDPRSLNPSVTTLAWPTLPVGAGAAVLVGALPAWLAPVPDDVRAER